MKIIIIVFLLSSLSINNKLQGIWKSTDNNTVKYLNFKPDGKLLEIKSKKHIVMILPQKKILFN